MKWQRLRENQSEGLFFGRPNSVSESNEKLFVFLHSWSINQSTERDAVCLRLASLLAWRIAPRNFYNFLQAFMFRNIKQKLFFSFLRFSIQPWYNETARTTSNLLCIAYFLLCHGTRPMCHSKQMRKGPRVIKQPNNRTGMKNWLFHSIFPVIYSSATECFKRVLYSDGRIAQSGAEMSVPAC